MTSVFFKEKFFGGSFFEDWDASSNGTLWGVPQGAESLALLALARAQGGSVASVAIDDAAMARMQASLIFWGVDPEQILLFPAWDCLPYDRISPARVITSQRLRCLSELVSTADKPRFVLTTVNAWLQRVPSRTMLNNNALSLEVGSVFTDGVLATFLSDNGYQRVETVRQTGDFAIRGGIVDIFPAGDIEPLRLDFFDTEIEALRRFDAATQLTTAKIDKAHLHPINEFVLNDEVISRFRQRYLENFGASAARDAIYISVTAGRYHAGMEHLLPLLHDRLEPLTSYLDMPVLLAHEADAKAQQRLAQIDDFYTARTEALEDDEDGTAAWRPLPPDALYLTKQEWQSEHSRYYQCSPFGKPDGHDIAGFDARGRAGGIYHAPRPKSLNEQNLNEQSLNEGDDSSATTTYSPSKAVAEAIVEFISAKASVVLVAASEGARTRLHELVGEHLAPPHTITHLDSIGELHEGQVYSAVWPVEDGFSLDNFIVITEKDIYGTRIANPKGRRRRRGENFLREVSTLEIGDLVVHIDHGIGCYEGLEKINTGGVDHDCLLIVYAEGDKLFLPVENIDLLSRYGKEEKDLDRLGSASWQSRKARIKGRIRDIAAKLIRTAAMRKTAKAETITPHTGDYAEFCQRFPYVETQDQLDTIDEVMGDLASGQAMDRLICGDVGFGKTEIVMRAAFAVAMAGYQVAVVTPTTLLARQHNQTFTDRFKGFPISIGVLSRMTNQAQASRLKKDISTGDCQIVIGTHALLAKTLEYSNLGLIIVDEEQNFGVAQKEKLKSLRGDIHVLTLSATPIPRTLQMALSGVREMSIIATPPVDRLAIRTSVGAWDPVVLSEAIRRERFRGGQVFCVCPRIEHLPQVYDKLQTMMPDARILEAHGQMSAKDLDEAMTRFSKSEADILLSTNIIESGIDIPSANTIIIHRADMFGLSQLYQLRGRVGRSHARAYAYLTIDPSRLLTTSAKRRLEVMQTLDALGAGFTLASYDLDIRGAGNLLGDEQSGHVREVGVELYQDMLKESITAMRLSTEQATTQEHDSQEEDTWSPVINLGNAVLIPDDYVADLTVRLSLYRRIAASETAADIDSLSVELIDRFGVIPDEVRNLLDTISIKILCRKAHIERVEAGPKGISLNFRKNTFPNPERLISYLSKQSGKMQLTSDHRLVQNKTLPRTGRAVAVKSVLEQIAALLD